MNTLNDLLRRAQSWPEYARKELEHVALQIEAELAAGDYVATPEELEAVDRGLRDANQGRFVSQAEIEETFRRFRNK
jgi:predicted transcriptional regulator